MGEEQHKKQTFLRLLMQAAQAGTFEWDMRTGRLTWSDELQRLYGFTPGKFPDTMDAWLDCVLPEDRTHAMTDLQASVASGGERISTFRIRRHDTGAVRWLEARGELLYDAEQHPIAMIGINVDVTERRYPEDSVRQSEARLRTVLDTLPVGVIIVDDHNQVIEANPLVEKIYGGDTPLHAPLQDYRQGRAWWGGTEITVAADEWPSAQALRTGEPVSGKEIDILRADDTRATVLDIAAPFRDEHGTITGAVVVIQDITDRKRAEAELRLAYARFERLFSSNVVGIIIVDPYGAIIESNDYYLQLLGFTREDFAAGRVRWNTLTPPEYAEADAKAIEELRIRGICTPYEKEYFRKDGTRIWVLITGILLPGSPEQILAVVIDITDRKHATEELQHINETLEERVRERTIALESTNKELEAFSYSVSHDLRAPLRSMDGFSQILMERYQAQLDAQGQDYLARVRAAAKRMGNLIDDLLKLSRIGRVPLRRETVNLSAVVQTVIDELRQRDPERRVIIDVQPDMMAQGDPSLLRIVFDNLLGNAWKFTSRREEARITVGVTQDSGERTYFIQDNGAGFDMTYADKLFTPFQRLHTEAEFPGSGIGLAIVQRIINRHGGHIWAESTEGEGTTIYFTLGAENM